ncbi:MAG: branched-chain amino acid ABC transporter permease [Spirochaetes bacterium]|nr:branched-chain amino acid ABC transporter permease [Spirochaetota bacterium]
MKKIKCIIIPVLTVLIFAAVPLAVDAERSFLVFTLFLSFCYIVLTQAWNLVAGYTGQVSMGQHAFFGLGAYTTALIWLHDITKTGYFFDPVTIILSGTVPVVLAVIIGIPLLSRLKGDYFALGTLGVGEIIKVIFVKGGSVTGASDGLHLPSTVYSSIKPYYWTGLLLAVFATAVVYFMIKSRIGLALRAIREDETSASAHGINILKYKVLAFAVGAFMAGVCGSLYGIYLFHINPDSVLKLDWTLYPILMCVIGGTGTIIGPVIGAFFMTLVFSITDIYFVQLHPVMAGLLIIIVMKFMPGGLAGLIKRKSAPGRKLIGLFSFSLSRKS